MPPPLATGVKAAQQPSVSGETTNNYRQELLQHATEMLNILCDDDDDNSEDSPLLHGLNVIYWYTATPDAAAALFNEHSDTLMPVLIRLATSGTITTAHRDMILLFERLMRNNPQVARAMWTRFPDVFQLALEEITLDGNNSNTRCCITLLANIVIPDENKQEIADRYPDLMQDLFALLRGDEEEEDDQQLDNNFMMNSTMNVLLDLFIVPHCDSFINNKHAGGHVPRSAAPRFNNPDFTSQLFATLLDSNAPGKVHDGGVLRPRVPA